MPDQQIRDRLKAATRPVVFRPLTMERLVERLDRRRARERATAAGLAIVLTAALIAGGLLVVDRGTSRPRAAGSGDSSSVHAPALAERQYLYRKAIGVGVRGRAVETTWWATNESGARRADCTAPPSDCRSGPQGTFAPGEFPSTVGDVSGLSSEPATLLRQLEERTAPGGGSPEPRSSGAQLSPGVSAGSLWLAVSNLAAASSGGPDLKAALFQVATGIPGVFVQRNVTDPVGRPAVALSLGDPSSGEAVTVLYFDPATGQLIAVGIAPDAHGGPFGYQVIETGIVDSIGSVPSGDRWLSPPISSPLPSPSGQP